MLISKALTIAVLVIFSYLIKNSTNVVNTFVSNEGKYHTIYHKRKTTINPARLVDQLKDKLKQKYLMS